MFKRTSQSRLSPSIWGKLLMVFCASLYLITLFDHQHRLALRAKKSKKHEKHQKGLLAGRNASGPAHQPLAGRKPRNKVGTLAVTQPEPLLLSEDFAAVGRRLECLELVSLQAERLQRMTLVRQPRRRATAYLATEALRVPGDFVEAGVFKGGTAIIMAAILACNNETGVVFHADGQQPRIRSSANRGVARRLWLADSFEGLPDPSWNAADMGGKQEAWDSLSKKWTASTSQLEENFQKFGSWWRKLPGVAEGRLGGWVNPLAWQKETLVGWFKDTLPTAPIEKVAFLRCDADMYSSTYECLDYMYAKVVPGGLIYIDDYWEFEACKRAVDGFRTKAKSGEPLMTIVEDGDYHFEPNFSASQVRSHRERHARGTAARHIDAVFWRKGST